MKANKSDRNNLAIIGASGTGKTTLAVGLYATSTEAFTVSPVGDETRKYLEIRKTSIEEGFWPAATNESENFDLRLRLHASGSQTDIVFREYMGERMERDPNYIREVIGTPKSAMILFNPGMPGLSKPETRNRMLGNLKVIAQHLKDNGCIAVAFVVTASDRLASDLAASREDFEAYASEVTNHLTNLDLDWKRFDVTVSGQLDDQNRPKLARGENNTTHAPFLWLLKRISDRKRCKCLLTAAAVFAIFVGVSSAVFGGLVVHSHQVLTRAETDFANTTNELNMAYASDDEAKVRTTSQFFETNSFDKIIAILPSDRTRKQELIKRANEQSDLWRIRLLNMELASTKSRIATKTLDWFEDFNKRLAASLPSFQAAVVERDMLTNEWTKVRSILETNCQVEHFRNAVDQERKNLFSTKPDGLSDTLQQSKILIADEEKKYALVTNREELCASLGLMTARTNAIVRYVDSKIGKPEDTNPPDTTTELRQKIRKELKRGLASKEFDNLPAVISQRCDVARKDWEYYQFPIQVQKQLDDLKAASATPAGALKNSRAFLERMDKLFSSIPENKRSTVKASITKERADAIGRYLDVKTPWEPDDDEPPVDASALQQQVRLELTSALTDSEFDSLLNELEKRRAEARVAWDALHFSRRVTQIETALKGAGANPSRPLTDSLAFLAAMTNNYPTISQVKFIEARNAIGALRQNAIVAYSNSIAVGWKVDGKKPPEFDCVKIRNTILTLDAVTDDEYQDFEKDINAQFTKAVQEWEANQKKLVDDEVNRYGKMNSVYAILTKYSEFIDDHPQNPYLNDLLDNVDGRLYKFLERYVDDYENDFRGDKRIGSEKYPRARMDRAGQRFYEFRTICAKFGEKGSLVKTPLLKRPSGHFANLCCNFGKLDDLGNTKFENVFPQTLRIKKVEVKFVPDSLDVDCKSLVLGCTLFSQRWNFQSNAWETISSPVVFSSKELARNSFGGNWTTVRNEVLDVLINPFSVLWFKIDYVDKMGNFWSMNQNGNCSFWLDFRPGSQSPEFSHDIRLVHAGNSDNEGKLSVRITFEGIGEDFQSLRANAQK